MKRVLGASLVAAVVAAAMAWVARGVYDDVLLDAGVFHVINADAAQRTIELAFPSGERRGVVLAAGQAASVHVANTGEGAVAVTADGEAVGAVGYVTGHNDLAIVVVQADRALFSNYLRSRSRDG